MQVPTRAGRAGLGTREQPVGSGDRPLEIRCKVDGAVVVRGDPSEVRQVWGPRIPEWQRRGRLKFRANSGILQEMRAASPARLRSSRRTGTTPCSVGAPGGCPAGQGHSAQNRSRSDGNLQLQPRGDLESCFLRAISKIVRTEAGSRPSGRASSQRSGLRTVVRASVCCWPERVQIWVRSLPN